MLKLISITILILAINAFSANDTIKPSLDYAIPESGSTTMRSSQLESREWIHHQIIQNKTNLNAWTKSCQEFSNPEIICPQENTLLKYKTESDNSAIFVKPILGVESRSLNTYNDNALAADGGLNLKAYIGNLSMYLDARIFTERHNSDSTYFYDREFLEKQDADEFSNLEYTSYARYRIAVTYNGNYGSIGFRRDALHWGPGLYNNLVMNGDAVPYPHFYYQGEIGPVRLMGAFGLLAIDGPLVITGQKGSATTRKLYAHRYEFNITPNLLMGMTEQLIVYDGLDPVDSVYREGGSLAAIIPLVPLFMEKGQGHEPFNNGNLSFDISYRFPSWFMVYGEFMIDDIQDPKQLFSENSENIWGAMWGVHGSHDFNNLQAGFVFEWARVEPWAYAHYYDSTAQIANRNYPLGNQSGANSRTITTKLYLRDNFKWNTGIKMEWLWKGTDLGSNINDQISDQPKPRTKIFLDGVDKPDFTISPSVAYTWRWLTFDLSADVHKNWNLDLISRLSLTF